MGGPTQRAVLALLALARGAVVSVDALLAGAWPGDGPASGSRALQTAVSRLRAALGNAGQLRAEGAGYALGLEPGVLDMERAESMSPADALALWRGPALEEFAELVAFAPERRRLEEWRWSLVETHGDVLLAGGEAARVCREWELHVGASPLRPRLWAQLMRALAATDRQADALRAYQRARDAFADAGLDPPADLVALEREVAAGTGTRRVTFLFTDVVGSTQRWESDAPAMAAALAVHDRAVADAVTGRGGRVLKSKGEGDSTVSVFASPADALAAAADAQRALELPVRMAVHVGEAEARDGDYFGPTLNRTARLRAIAHGGQVICSGAAANAANGTLDGGLALLDMGMHQLKDLAEPEHVFQLAGDGLAGDFPPLLSLSRALTNLPAQTTSFIGREAELERVAELLAASRLVTLTGAGGSGKTRLSLQAAADAIDTYPDGVWLAQLAPISDPDGVANVVAAALGVSAPPGSSVTGQVVASLGAKQALVILDNCEHVIEGAAAFAAALLAGCPNVTVLATSRERLRVPAETAWPVPVLELPEDDAMAADSEAVRLFVDRATDADPSFSFDVDAHAVIEICRRLDGIPLAIELAAARVRTIAPPDLAKRIADHRNLVSGGDRTALARHRSLRATIEWSHSLLADDERQALHRLAMFRGGWTLDSAERLVGDLDGLPAIDALEGLVDKSLVNVDGRTRRYSMLETVREFALEQLQAGGEVEQWQARHAAEVEALTGDMRRLLGTGMTQLAAVSSFRAERDNLTAALDWSTENDHELAGRILGNVWEIWYVLDQRAESHPWYRELHAFASELPVTVAARPLTGAGTVLGYAGDHDAGVELLSGAVAAARQTGSNGDLAMALVFLAAIHRIFDEVDVAGPLAAEALALSLDGEDVIVRGMVKVFAALYDMDIGNRDKSGPAFIEAYEMAVAEGDSYVRGMVLPFLPDDYIDRDTRMAELAEILAAAEGGDDVNVDDGRPYQLMNEGRYEAAVAALEAALAQPQVHYRRAIEYRQALALAYAAVDRPADAVAALQPLLDGGAPITMIDRLRTLSILIAPAHATGDDDRARAARDEVLTAFRADEIPPSAYSYNSAREWAGTLLVVAAALEDLERARHVVTVGAALRGGWDGDVWEPEVTVALARTQPLASDEVYKRAAALSIAEAIDLAFEG